MVVAWAADRTHRPARASERILFMGLIFHCCSGNKTHGTVLVERPARSLKIKNLQTPAKRGMKVSYESRRKIFVRLASSFSLTEKCLRKYSESDECNQTDILTSVSNLIPAFPI